MDAGRPREPRRLPRLGHRECKHVSLEPPLVETHLEGALGRRKYDRSRARRALRSQCRFLHQLCNVSDTAQHRRYCAVRDSKDVSIRRKSDPIVAKLCPTDHPVCLASHRQQGWQDSCDVRRRRQRQPYLYRSLKRINSVLRPVDPLQRLQRHNTELDNELHFVDLADACGPPPGQCPPAGLL